MKECVYTRQVKMVIIFLHNWLFRLIPFFYLKNLYLGVFPKHKIGKGVSLHIPVKLYGFGRFECGDYSVINSHCEIDNRIGVRIGKNVSISHGVKIYSLGHDIHSDDFGTKGEEVVIGDYAVIFSQALIMPGVKIGKGAVVFPGSVVTKDVPELMVVGGNPAKEIMKRNSELGYQLNYGYWFAV